MENKVVYRHRRLDTNEVFYIGIGSIKRSKDKWSRSEMWYRTVKKAKGYSIEILAENLSLEDACELEIFLIQLYGRKNLKKGPLTNLSDGGETNTNLIMSDEHKRKISEANKGKQISKEQKEIISKALTGIKHTEERIEANRQRSIEWHKSNTNGMAKKVICTETGVVWNSAAECARQNGINQFTLRERLNGNKKNNTIYKYLENGK